VNLLAVPEVGGIVLNLSDRTESRRALEQLMVDPLTGLGNRRAVEHRLDSPDRVIAMLIDLDNFKAVNDTYGHSVGDEILVSVSRRLQHAFGVEALVCRIGGDEFLVILPESELDRAWSRAETALVSVRAPIGESAIRVTASIGIAYSKPGEGRSVLARADIAMYQAKAAGKEKILAAHDEAHEWELRRRAAPGALENAMGQVAKLKAQLARLEDQNRINQRTGLLSAEAYEADIVGIDIVARQESRRYAIALCDIDYFGRFNNLYGYTNGDDVLRSTAEAMKAACWPGDLVYRYGGEELLVVLPDTQLHDAAALGERLRRSVEALQIVHTNRPEPHHVTISVGVAALDTEHHEDHQGVFDAANRCLRIAKDDGRNRVDPAPSQP
jgi:diguanylate cyclase (GGDEF)-like protein